MEKHVESLVQTEPLSGNPFFRALASGEMTRAQFVETQRHFYHAVVFFSRPMMLLSSRLPDYGARWALLQNATDEHGGGERTQTHGATFLALLRQLDAAPSKEPAACVDLFNLALMGACGHRDWRIATAMLGVIEERFSTISNQLGKSIVLRGWLERDQVRHYAIHEQLDVGHARSFYQLLREEWETEEGRRTTERGLRLGNRLFMDLYDGLWRVVAG
jgi:hypothetical protein